jgi:hypothetical protein
MMLKIKLSELNGGAWGKPAKFVFFKFEIWFDFLVVEPNIL